MRASALAFSVTGSYRPGERMIAASSALWLSVSFAARLPK